MKKLVFAATLIIGCALAAPAYADHSWGNYHWARTTNPFTLKLGDNVTTQWDAYLAEASADWNASAVLDTSIVPGLASRRTCKPTTGRIEVCNDRYGSNGWLGIATVWADASGHITKATTKLNDTYFTTATYNTPAWRRLVMCQEIAHDFGLAHQDETFTNANLGSCMDYTNDPDGGVGGASATDPSNEHPNQHDFDQLAVVYGSHTDGYATIGATVAQLKAIARTLVVVDEDDDWGRAVGHTHGRADEFIKEYGNGSVKVTHVFWVPDTDVY